MRNGTYKITDVPKQYKDIVVRALGPDVKAPARMSPAERKDVDEAKGLIAQINTDILPDLEPVKGNNTPGYFAAGRVGYALGMKTKASDLISFSERLKAVSSRLLAGGRLSRQMYDRLTSHLPNFYTDSPALAYSKLVDARTTLQQQITAMDAGAATSNEPQGGGASVKFRASDGSVWTIPAGSLDAARKRDPKLQVIQ